MVCIANYVLYEDLAAMGITNQPKRCLYIIGAPPSRGGPARADARYLEFNSLYFGQTELDRHFFVSKFKDPVTLENVEREIFPDLTFLPLPIDVDLPATTPNVDELVIAQAMSAGVMTGVSGKGFYYIERAQNQLSFDIDLIFGVSREECLDRKCSASLVYDNNMGNIGVSGLESMAQGMPVIGRFSPIIKENWERLSGGVEFPIISFNDQDGLNNLLESYMLDTSQLTAIGSASRDWMQTYATGENIANYWCNTIQEKIS